MRRPLALALVALCTLALAAPDAFDETARFDLAKQDLAKKGAKPKAMGTERQPASAPSTTEAAATTSAPVLPFDAFFGLGAQLGGGFQIGPSLELRSPWLLPLKLRPYVDAGFFFPIDRKFYSVPLSGGIVWKGPQDTWSPLSVALGGGVLFTNETGTPKSLLVLGSVGWETRLGGLDFFAQARVGMAGRDLVAYPRLGLVVML